jgi:pyruvate dehydrogenase E1 component beta subunit
MTTEILMPALSPTMEEGTLAKWLVKEGDTVSAGDILAEIETDKATMEFEAVDEGTIEKILVSEGSEGIKVNSPIAILIDDGEKITETKINNAPKEQKAFAENKKLHPKVELLSTEPTPEPEWTDTTKIGQKTVREALRDAMAEELRRDEKVFLMGEEVAEYQGAYKVSQGLLEEFGSKRIIDTPITEHGFAGIATGASFAGLRPIVEFMTFNFAMQAIDQIVNSAAKTLYMSGGQMGAPIVFRGPNGAAARVGAQHSQDYTSWYAHIPGLKVVAPYSASDAKGLLKSAIRDNNPVIFLENEILYGRSFEVPEIEDYIVPFGKARVWRKGADVTIISFGIGMQYALKAAEELTAEGIEAEVIDLRTIRPIDYETIIQSVSKTNRCITVEEGFPVASIGNHLSAYIMEHAFDYLDAPVINCTGKDVPMPYAANLEKLALVTTEQVVNAAKKVCYR